MKLHERTSAERRAYVDTVRRGLRDVPATFRDELLADLSARLDDLPPGASVEEVLGTGTEYARLACEAAGYGSPRPERFPSLATWTVRRTTALALVTILVVAAIGVGVWRARYQPLQAVTIGGWSNAATIDSDVPTNANYWRYQPGATLVVTAQLRNRGHATATVTAVSVPNPSGPFVPIGLRWTKDEQLLGTWPRATPAQRVSVHPGETVYLFVVMRLQSQHLGPRDSESEALPTLHIEVLGVHHLVPIVGADIGTANP